VRPPAFKSEPKVYAELGLAAVLRGPCSTSGLFKWRDPLFSLEFWESELGDFMRPLGSSSETVGTESLKG
jgi:hypothetical protein